MMLTPGSLPSSRVLWVLLAVPASLVLLVPRYVPCWSSREAPFPYNLCWLIAPWRSPFPCEVCHPQPSMLLSMEAWKRQVFCSITS